MSTTVTDGVIPVPIVESGTSTPYPTQTCTRVDRDAASTTARSGPVARRTAPSGRAGCAARSPRSRREPHGPVDQAEGEPRHDVGGDGGVQATAGAPPQVVRRPPPAGRCAASSRTTGAGRTRWYVPAGAPTGTGGAATGRRLALLCTERPTARRWCHNTSRDSAGVTTTVALIATRSRPSGSGGWGHRASTSPPGAGRRRRRSTRKSDRRDTVIRSFSYVSKGALFRTKGKHFRFLALH